MSPSEIANHQLKKLPPLCALILFSAGLFVAVLAVGCGRDEPDPEMVDVPKAAAPVSKDADRAAPSPSDPETNDVAERQAPASSSGSAPVAAEEPETPEDPEVDSAARPVLPDELAAELDEILELERDAQFGKALHAYRELRKKIEDPEVLRQLKKIESRLVDEQRSSLGLNFAVEKLDNPDSRIVRIAARKLRDAGEAGRIYLRKAVREARPAIAAMAAEILAEEKDAKACASLIERFADDPVSPPAPAILRALREMPGNLTPDDVAVLAEIALHPSKAEDENELPEAAFELLEQTADRISQDTWRKFYQIAQGDDAFARTGVVELLGAAFAKTSDKSKERFGELVGDPDAYETLAAYVREAAMSEREDLQAWAIREAYVFRPLVHGWRGQYFRGTNHEKVVHEQLDAKIDFEKGNFPIPGGHDNFSVRWSGLVRVMKAGTYTFYMASDDGQRMWVNNRLIIDDWNHHGVKRVQGTIDLEPGLYPIRVEFFQGGGGAATEVHWSGPGFEKELLGAGDVMTKVWPGITDGEEGEAR